MGIVVVCCHGNASRKNESILWLTPYAVLHEHKKETIMAFGRSVFVTGANRGIGLELVTQLLRHQNRPEFIFAACRSPDGAAVNLFSIAYLFIPSCSLDLKLWMEHGRMQTDCGSEASKITWKFVSHRWRFDTSSYVVNTVVCCQKRRVNITCRDIRLKKLIQTNNPPKNGSMYNKWKMKSLRPFYILD